MLMDVSMLTLSPLEGDPLVATPQSHVLRQEKIRDRGCFLESDCCHLGMNQTPSAASCSLKDQTHLHHYISITEIP